VPGCSLAKWPQETLQENHTPLSLFVADAASQDDVAKATNILEDVARTARRRPSCEQGARINRALDAAREKLASLETKRRRSTRTQAALEAAVLAM